MGTNYYWRDQPCGTCRRFEQVHVGKQSGGWSFLFRAWPHQLMDVNHPGWGFEPQSLFGFPVLSRADWRTVFTTRDGQLWDEYGKQVDDPTAWLDGLTVPDAAQIAKEATWMGGWRSEDEPRDPEGFRISTADFS